MKYRTCTVLLALVLSAALYGCGFQLAGANLSSLLPEGLSVTTPNSHRSFGNELEHALSRAGVARDGKWHVEVLSVSRGGETLLSSPDDYDQERLISLKVSFRITSPAGQASPKRNIVARRRLSQNFSRLNVSTELSRFYRTEMEQELAGRLVRYVATLARERNTIGFFETESDIPDVKKAAQELIP